MSTSIYELPVFDIDELYSSGVLRAKGGGSSEFFQVPPEYHARLPSILRTPPGIDPHPLGLPLIVTSEGICSIVLGNHEESFSKYLQSEFDGVQLLVNAIWRNHLTDVFDIPIFTYTDYLCFRVVSAPLQMWVREEPNLVRFRYNEKLDPVFTQLEQHMFGARLKPLLLDPSVDPPLLLESVQRQRLVLNRLAHLNPMFEPSSDLINTVVSRMEDFDFLVTSPLVFRSLLRELGFPVRCLGKLLLHATLPCLKQVLVNDMVTRRAKWHFRKIQFIDYIDGRSMGRLSWEDLVQSAEFCDRMIDSASSYFGVHVDELIPYFTSISLYGVGVGEGRVVFPHLDLITPKTCANEPYGFFPRTRCMYPRPPSVSVRTLGKSPLDWLPLRYAGFVYSLEMVMAIGDFAQASVTLSGLADTSLRMMELEPVEENKTMLGQRAVALAAESVKLTPLRMTPPVAALRTIVQISQSFERYKSLRGVVVDNEGDDSFTLLALDCAMAKSINNPEHAVAMLASCSIRAEKALGARHSVTVSCWVQLAQAIKRYIEQGSLSEKLRQSLLREGITCLNKAKLAAQMADPDIPLTGPLDHGSMIHYLLSMLYLWNGEPGKALAVSREGLVVLESKFSVYHPRYLNSAFLHAKLLEMHAASVRDKAASIACAREAVNVLEDVLGSLLDLTDDSGVLRQELFSFDEFLGGTEQFQRDVDMKRKLSVCALILRMDIWLMDEVTARDVLDLIVCDELDGSIGVAELPGRILVRQNVVKTVERRLNEINGQRGDKKLLPVLDMTTALPEAVVNGCNLALIAKSKGQRVTEWFHQFLQVTTMSFGDSLANQNQNILKTIFLTFIYIENMDNVWVGPISAPLVPAWRTEQKSYNSTIYREWERSATLYCIDHELFGA
jgi:hypothetical protein